MSKEDQTVPVEQTEDTSGTQSEETNQDAVAYVSYKKVLNEKKNVQTENETLKNELKLLRDSKLKAEGKKDELLVEYEKRITELQTENQKTKQNFAWSTLTGKIREEAVKHGCSDPNKLIKLMDDDDLRAIEVGEDFSVKSDSLKKVIEKNKRENFFLFSDSKKMVADGVPKTKVDTNKGKDLSKLSMEELKDKYKEIYK